MKALVVNSPENIELANLEKPVIHLPHQVLIKVLAAGICGSDVHVYHGRNPYARYPVIPGHEISGIVEEVGSEVTKFKQGDRVVVEPIQTCGHCYPCRIGRPNVCENLHVYGAHINGGFAEYMMATDASLHHIPDTITMKQAAMIEPMTISAQAMFRTNAQKGDLCLIHGAGPIGLTTLIMAKKLGLTCVVSELDERRSEVARTLGADLLINPSKEPLASKIMEITDGKGVNIIYDAVGTSSVIEASLPLLSGAGRLLEYGYGFGTAKIDFDLMNKKELTVLGLRHQTYRFEPVIHLFPSLLREVDMMQTHSFSLEQFKEAFAAYEDIRSGACKITFLL